MNHELKLGKKIKISSKLSFKMFLFYSAGKTRQKRRPKQDNDNSSKKKLKVCVLLSILVYNNIIILNYYVYKL